MPPSPIRGKSSVLLTSLASSPRSHSHSPAQPQQPRDLLPSAFCCSWAKEIATKPRRTTKPRTEFWTGVEWNKSISGIIIDQPLGKESRIIVCNACTITQQPCLGRAKSYSVGFRLSHASIHCSRQGGSWSSCVWQSSSNCRQTRGGAEH